MNKNIFYLSGSIIPSMSANSVHVMKMAQAFAENGYDTFLLAPNIKDREETNVKDIYSYYNVKKNFKIVKLKYFTNVLGGKIQYILGTLIYLFNILIFLRKYRTSIIYGRFLIGCSILSLFGFKVIYESHAPVNKLGFINLLFFKLMIKYGNILKLVVITNSLKKNYIKELGIRKENIIIAPDGADKASVISDHQNKSFTVGYCGSLNKGKGIELIVKIAEKIKNVKFIIVGGNQDDIKKWKSISSNNITYIGFIPQNQLSYYINSFDVALLPNQKKVFAYGSTNKSSLNIADYTSPMKMFEYMSYKKPIIASDLEVLKEVLTDQYNALLVAFDDADKWIEAIHYLQKDKILMDKIANNAYNDFLQKYTWKQRVNNLMSEIDV